jgi:hypothetical protein
MLEHLIKLVETDSRFKNYQLHGANFWCLILALNLFTQTALGTRAGFPLCSITGGCIWKGKGPDGQGKTLPFIQMHCVTPRALRPRKNSNHVENISHHLYQPGLVVPGETAGNHTSLHRLYGHGAGMCRDSGRRFYCILLYPWLALALPSFLT